MYAKNSSLLRPAGLWAGTLLAASCAWAAPAATDAFPLFDNYFLPSVQLASVKGDNTAFKARDWSARSGAGIYDFRYSNDLSKDVTLLMDARALGGTSDYLGHLNLTKSEVGSVDIGYKRFRTFYDGVGGFFPINNNWNALPNQDLHVDRSKFWAEATIALPNKPVFTFRYTNELRNGRKDSTIWGDTDFTGIPIYSLSSLNPISSNRKILPAFLDLGERKATWEAAVNHKVGNTKLMFSVVGDRIDNLDTRSVDRYTGELKPFPAIPSNPVTLVSPALANNPNHGFDRQGFKENAVTYTGKIETILSSIVTAYVSGSYRHATEDIAASRLISADLKTTVAPGLVSAVGLFTANGRPPYSYNSKGHLKNNVYTGNFGLEIKPSKNLHINAAVRTEEYKASGLNEATFINTLVVQSTGVATQQLVYAPNSAKYKETPFTPSLDIRYTGITNVSLYATFDYRRSPGTEYKNYENINPSGSLILPTLALFDESVSEKHSYYRAGINWMAFSALTLRAEVFKKDHENSFTDNGAGGGYFIFDYNTYGSRLTATLKATQQLSFTTRYVFQHGTGAVAEDGYVKGDSNDTKTYQICETVDWNPTKQFYMQGNVNVVYSQMMTAYPKSTGAALDVLHNANNNYWNGSALAGFVVNKETDAQLEYTYYYANNYQPSLAASTVPYGAAAKEYTITLGLKHKFTDRLIGLAKIGYFSSQNDTTGGFTNYRARLACLTLDYKL